MEVIIPLEAKAERTKVEDNLLELNQKLVDVTKENQKAATIAIEIVLGIGIGLSIVGAYYWHEKIHKRDDKLAQLQIEKLEAEVAKLRNELSNSNPSSSASGA
jgi:uncharacterized protein HemX